MASFADTWMFAPDPYDVWLHWMVEEPSFDRSLWFVAEQDGELAGIVIARAPEQEPGVGWVRHLGVVPERRRRGLGQALLQHTFAEFARRGFTAVGLGVDAENPTGAVSVYERAGMHVERTNLIFEKSQG
jgi:ribosomal protein S18 acetylase RimI-like enzyme